MLYGKNYEIESISIVSLILSIFFFFACIIFAIALYKKEVFEGFIAFLVVDIILVLCIVLSYFQYKKFVNKRNLIIKTGIKITGKVIDTHFVVEAEDMSKSAIVSYNYENQEKTFDTPTLAFKDIDIMNKEVDVYVSDAGIYVDFKINTKGVLAVK